MRITQQMIANQNLQDLMNNEQQIARYESQLASGQQVQQISDNPAAGSQIMALQSNLAAVSQYLRNDQSATNWLSATDSALNGVDQTVQRAHELSVQAANDTLSASDRQNIASEVDGLINQVVDAGNSDYAGSYLFGGSQTTTQPFTNNGGTIVYNVTDPTVATKPLQREVAPGVQVTINTVGHDPGTNGALFDQIFSALTSFRQALGNNDTSAIQNSIQTISDSLDALSNTRAQVGARMNQVTAAQGQVTNLQFVLTQQQSNLQDANVAQSITDLNSATLVRQSSLAALAKVLPGSLFNYLQ